MRLFSYLSNLFKKKDIQSRQPISQAICNINRLERIVVSPTPRQVDTSVHLSSNILIKSNGSAVGAVQNITFEETASVPNVSRALVKGHCSRIRFDRARIVEAFAGQTHLTPKHKPFDMEIVETVGDECRTTTVKNCNILSTHVTYTVDDWIILEHIDFEAESISTDQMVSISPPILLPFKSISI